MHGPDLWPAVVMHEGVRAGVEALRCISDSTGRFTSYPQPWGGGGPQSADVAVGVPLLFTGLAWATGDTSCRPCLAESVVPAWGPHLAVVGAARLGAVTAALGEDEGFVHTILGFRV
jgi:hypothetical protein